MKRILPILAVLIILVIPGVVSAADHYVSPTGSASWSACMSISTPCSLNIANSNAQAGDTVYLRDGTYSTGIAPASQGASDSIRIVYMAYAGENPEIRGTRCITLIDRDYVTVDNVDCSNPYNQAGFVDMRNSGGASSDYNIIKDCTFTNSETCGGVCPDEGLYSRWAAVYIQGGSYNQFLNNTLDQSGGDVSYQDLVSLTPSGGDNAIANIFYGNTFRYAAHTVIELQAGSGYTPKYTIFKDNVIDATKWHTGLNIFSGSTYALVDGNTIKGAGSGCSSTTDCGCPSDNICSVSSDDHKDGFPSNGHKNLQGAYSYSIVRRNEIYGGGSGMSLNSYDSIVDRIYHNTIYDNVEGYGTNTAILVTDVFWKNNIFYQNSQWDEETSEIRYSFRLGTTHASDINVYLINNLVEDTGTSSDVHIYKIGGSTPIKADDIDWWDTNYPAYFSGNIGDADPMFSDSAGEDFSLQSDSPAIDKGTWLTQVNDTGGGSGTSMVVDDARYFYTTGSPWNTPGTVMKDDTIYVDNPSSADFTITITAIDYNTNTLTLASSQDWEDNAYVYQCPDGVCFSGSSPDIGAFEYSESPSCDDQDGDGYGIGDSCLGPDCDDSNPAVNQTISCSYDGSSCGTHSLCLLACPTPPAESCTNFLDDDCDSMSDCSDPDCSGDSYCQNRTQLFETQLSKDTLLESAYPDNDYGSQSTFYIGSRNDGWGSRLLLKFPGLISPDAVPAGSSITSATLTLTHTGSQRITSPIGLRVRRVLESWTEGDSTGLADPGESTWNYRSYDTVAWTDAGCSTPGSSTTTDEASATYSANPSEGEASSLDVTSIVQSWSNSGESSNHGFLLIAPGQELSAANYVRFASSEFSNPDYRPKLSVSFVEWVHRADTTAPFGCIDQTELTSFINLWYLDSTEYAMPELMEAVGLWKNPGPGC